MKAAVIGKTGMFHAGVVNFKTALLAKFNFDALFFPYCLTDPAVIRNLSEVPAMFHRHVIKKYMTVPAFSLPRIDFTAIGTSRREYAVGNFLEIPLRWKTASPA